MNERLYCNTVFYSMNYKTWLMMRWEMIAFDAFDVMRPVVIQNEMYKSDHHQIQPYLDCSQH
jgi:hypothetical protein